MRALLLPTLLALAGILAPTAAGQAAQPTDRCARSCDPVTLNPGAPLEGDAPVNVVLFAHFEDLINFAALNAQPPDPWSEKDLDGGIATPTLDTNTNVCPDPPGNTCLDVHFKNNEFNMVSNPMLIRSPVDAWHETLAPGIGSSIQLGAPTLHAYWYMSAHPSAPSAPAVGVVPALAIYARLETGVFKFHGELVAATPEFSTPIGERANLISVPGQPPVYEFDVLLRTLRDSIPLDPVTPGFHLYLSVYQVKTDAKDGVEAAQADWRVHTGPDFPPRLVLPVVRPLVPSPLSFKMQGDDLYARWSLTPALGAYDVQPGSFRLDTHGEGPTALFLPFFVSQREDRPGLLRPVNASWAADLKKAPLADGIYTVQASALNLQGTYRATTEASFTVTNGIPQVDNAPPPPKRSPAPDVAISVLPLLAALVLARRR